MSQITHTGSPLRQLVSAEDLRRICRASGDSRMRPSDFSPGDEWDAGDAACAFCAHADTHEDGCPGEDDDGAGAVPMTQIQRIRVPLRAKQALVDGRHAWPTGHAISTWRSLARRGLATETDGECDGCCRHRPGHLVPVFRLHDGVVLVAP